MMNDSDAAGERDRLVAIAMQAIERRGTEITKSVLAAEAQVARARVDRLFPEESDLFDAIVEQWFQPLVAIMEDVLATDLPPNRKMYEFFARRFQHQRARFNADPAAFALYCELGQDHWQDVRSYVDLADHYLSELIAQAQADGYFSGYSINETLTLINQMVICYIQPVLLMMVGDRLTEEKLARIIDTLFAGLSAKDGGARGVSGLRVASADLA